MLQQAGRISHRVSIVTDPLERPPPLLAWQLDFKDASSVPADPDGKRQHVVEILNTIDTGTSVLLGAQVRDDFTAQTALLAVAELLRSHGRPQSLRWDRDPRLVSSPHGSDFPCALIRFCQCLDIAVLVCDPHHPAQNGFVERYHRSYQEECLSVQCPRTLAEVRQVTAEFEQHYNFQRPHQGLSCGNQPPRVAWPTLPLLPPVPDIVDPDRWLMHCDGLNVVRTVSRHGSVRVDLHDYYVLRALAGQRVTLVVRAAQRSLSVIHQGQRVKVLPIKGLHAAALAFEDFVRLMSQQARAQARLRTSQERRARLGGMSTP